MRLRRCAGDPGFCIFNSASAKNRSAHFDEKLLLGARLTDFALNVDTLVFGSEVPRKTGLVDSASNQLLPEHLLYIYGLDIREFSNAKDGKLATIARRFYASHR